MSNAKERLHQAALFVSIFIDDKIALMKFSRRLLALPVLLGLLACRPVLTVGWSELFIFGMILLVLAGPSLWRFYKRYRKFRDYEKKGK
jgi:hypothetical protein